MSFQANDLFQTSGFPYPIAWTTDASISSSADISAQDFGTHQDLYRVEMDPPSVPSLAHFPPNFLPVIQPNASPIFDPLDEIIRFIIKWLKRSLGCPIITNGLNEGVR
jgi:hypothetical protein